MVDLADVHPGRQRGAPGGRAAPGDVGSGSGPGRAGILPGGARRRRSARPLRWVAAVGVAAVLAGIGPGVAGAVPSGATGAAESRGVPDPAATENPAAWPDVEGARPTLRGGPSWVRLAGEDRYQTSLASTLALRGMGGFPFDTPDRGVDGAALARAQDWWGARTCPTAVIIAAGDTPADALAASALSDPTDGSSEPLLQRFAAADPVFDPIGGFDRVDAQGAPILVVSSARQGSTRLDLSAQIAAQDLAKGGCGRARNAIVVGGATAVSRQVEGELITLGYSEVFRVAGDDRYDTAARIARALGTGPGTEGRTCVDPDTADGSRQGFYGNAVVEWRPGTAECRLLGRTVVLTDGITGADALAAGWWTSFWQVPVLLTGPGGTLPEPTRQALVTLDVENVVVLGGTVRIPDATLAEVEALAGAATHRLAGEDRYATSALMARVLGGWWAGAPTAAAGSLVCVAASAGDGPTARGWPDALGAGPWCGTASGAAADPGAPSRALAPTNGSTPQATPVDPGRPGRDAVPVLLVAPGTGEVPASVAELLRGAFPPGAPWCSGEASPSPCAESGFGVVFGGPGVVSEDAAGAVGRLLSASTAPLDLGTVVAAGLAPGLSDAFATGLDLRPVFTVVAGEVSSPDQPAGQVSPPGQPAGLVTAAGTVGAAELPVGPRGCVLRGGAAGVRWLSMTAERDRTVLDQHADIQLGGVYRTDADGVVRSPGTSAPACLAAAAEPAGHDGTGWWWGVSLAGRVAGGFEVPWAQPARRLEMTGPLLMNAPASITGVPPSTPHGGGGTTTWVYGPAAPGAPAPSLKVAGQSAPVTSARLELTLTRGVDTPGVTAPDRFGGPLELVTPSGTVTGALTGEAVLEGSVWRFRGRVIVTGGTWGTPTGEGGFVADLVLAGPGAPADAVSWRLDAVLDERP